jgi:hypothetical protein
MFNNALDHAECKNIICMFQLKKGNIHIQIYDDGVGIFNKLKKAFGFESIREAILHLSKGKVTTDPEKHTGEGIFFTSRIFDDFELYSSKMLYTREHEDEWFLQKEKHAPDRGTLVELVLSVNSERTLNDIFKKYTATEDFGFHKTVVAVKLSSSDEESHISRSEAKRLLAGLEKFKHVILDYSDVITVGQGFVDEIYRVFKDAYPDIRITSVNVNDDVEFMIQRSAGERKNEPS